MTEPWLPEGFAHPARVQIEPGLHLRPIRASDVDIDMPAVMGNRDMLWRMYGEAWGWPEPTMTREHDERDLARHAAEMEAHESFNYAILPADEDALLGCVYIDPLPGEPEGPAAEVSWWVVADAPQGTREAVDAFVPAWIRDQWPFVRFTMPFQGRA